jgi:hypothetical protein
MFEKSVTVKTGPELKVSGRSSNARRQSVLVALHRYAIGYIGRSKQKDDPLSSRLLAASKTGKLETRTPESMKKK